MVSPRQIASSGHSPGPVNAPPLCSGHRANHRPAPTGRVWAAGHYAWRIGPDPPASTSTSAPGGAAVQARPVSRSLVRYGAHPSQLVELWLPLGEGLLPTVVLLHGGFWRARYAKGLMNPLARALSARGAAVVNAEYRRCGRDGGWPYTLEDVATAVDLVSQAEGLDVHRVVVCGHSAGGQLALWAAARHRLPPGAPGGRPVVRPCGAVSLAGVADLVAAARSGVGAGAVQDLLGGPPEAFADRYTVASPLALVPTGVPTVLVHGAADDVVPITLSTSYVRAGQSAGDPVELVEVPGADHMSVIRPATPAGSAALSAVLALLGQGPPGQ